MYITKVRFNGGKDEAESKECGVDVSVTVHDDDEEFDEEYCVGTLVWDHDMDDEYDEGDPEWILWRGEGYTDYEYIQKYLGGHSDTAAVGYDDDLEYAEECIREEFLQCGD